jgi:hypothetical protein
VNTNLSYTGNIAPIFKWDQATGDRMSSPPLVVWLIIIS